MTVDFNAPEPAPVEASTGREVWPTVFDNDALPAWLRDDMRARHFVGVRRYGQPLRTWNGRNAVVDAYQEALDLVVYLTQALLRLEGAKQPTFSKLWAARNEALTIAITLGELARSNEVPTTKETP